MGAPLTSAAFADDARALLPRLLNSVPAKVIALKCKVSARTAEGWKRGEHLPGLEHIGALMAVLPDFAAFFQAWAGHCLEPELFDNEQRAFNDYAARKIRGAR